MAGVLFFLLFNHSFHSLLSRKDSRCQSSLLNIQLCRISQPLSCCWQEKIGMFKRIMRFLIYYEYVTKCLPDAYYALNPNQTVLNEFLRLQGTPCDTMWHLVTHTKIGLNLIMLLYLIGPISYFHFIVLYGKGLSMGIINPWSSFALSFQKYSPCNTLKEIFFSCVHRVVFKWLSKNQPTDQSKHGQTAQWTNHNSKQLRVTCWKCGKNHATSFDWFCFSLAENLARDFQANH